jgi:hypothetical protein
MNNLKRQNQWHKTLAFMGESKSSSIDTVLILRNFAKMAPSGRLKGLQPHGEELGILLGKNLEVVDKESSFVLLKDLIREHGKTLAFLMNKLKYCF